MPSPSAITAAAFSPRSNSRTPGASPRAASRRSAPTLAAPNAPEALFHLEQTSTSPATTAAPNAPEAANVAPETAVAAEPQSAAAKPEPGAPKKLRRSRVPGNLAQIYGESTAKRDVEAAPLVEEPKKARRDAQAREKRRALMSVPEDLRERLSQGASGVLIVGEEEGAPARRGRTWQAACGKCGTRSTFRTPGALCPTCGAICLRDVA